MLIDMEEVAPHESPESMLNSTGHFTEMSSLSTNDSRRDVKMTYRGSWL